MTIARRRGLGWRVCRGPREDLSRFFLLWLGKHLGLSLADLFLSWINVFLDLQMGWYSFILHGDRLYYATGAKTKVKHSYFRYFFVKNPTQ